jgi:hypothetical protein
MENSSIPVTSDLAICCVHLARTGIYIALSPVVTQEGDWTMRNYLVFIHAPDSAMVSKVEVVRAFSRRSAMKKLERQGFRKKKF